MLDIAIFGEDGISGRYLKRVGLDIDDHEKIFFHIKSHEGCFLKKIEDYYADAKISPAELNQFLEEINYLDAQFGDDVDFRNLLKALKEISLEAKSKNVALNIVAD